MKRFPTQHQVRRLHDNTHAHNEILFFATETISDTTPDVAIDCGTAENISTQLQNRRPLPEKAKKKQLTDKGKRKKKEENN